VDDVDNQNPVLVDAAEDQVVADCARPDAAAFTTGDQRIGVG
jgi:hypothetical protein